MVESDEMTEKLERDVIFAEEAFIADVQFAIHNLMLDKKVSRAKLARALNVSQPRITQMFGDTAKNLTLRTVARVFHILGEEPRISSERLDQLLHSPEAMRDVASEKWKDEGLIKLLGLTEAELQNCVDPFEQSNDNDLEVAIAA